LLGAIDQATANHTSNITPSLPFPVNDPTNHNNGPHDFEFIQVTNSTCEHASGVVN